MMLRRGVPVQQLPCIRLCHMNINPLSKCLKWIVLVRDNFFQSTDHVSAGASRFS